jgi:hypothetical protein
VEQSTETRVRVVTSKSKGKKFLNFIPKFSKAQELMSWDNGTTLISKFELHLQGSFQLNWQEILNLTDPNDNCNVAYFEEQVQNSLNDIFAEDKWTDIWPTTSMTTLQVFAHLCHMIATTQQLPNAPQELFTINEQKRILLHMFPIN